MSESFPFQRPNNNANGYPSEAQRALEREQQLPLTVGNKKLIKG